MYFLRSLGSCEQCGMKVLLSRPIRALFTGVHWAEPFHNSAKIAWSGRVSGSQGGTVCAQVQDAAKRMSHIKGDGSPEHLAIELVSFLHQTWSTVGLSLLKEKIDKPPAANSVLFCGRNRLEEEISDVGPETPQNYDPTSHGDGKNTASCMGFCSAFCHFFF